MVYKFIAITTLIGAITMTGIAMAAGIDANPNPISLNVNEGKSQKVNITSDGPAISKFIIDGVGFNPTDRFIISIRDPDGVIHNGSEIENSNPLGWASPATFIVTYNNKVESNNDYLLKYKVFWVGNPDPYDADSVIRVQITPTPEFPTVALPVAAIIGLVFLFQHRKDKED
ncbi:MAG: PEF-CTERM sorting domain-containing protein, partial [Candidatus Methanoperedens sp.]|nr:PEF-CTERM sorting domain-containing protein [Candidatus Methanoperedens sp.]